MTHLPDFEVVGKADARDYALDATAGYLVALDGYSRMAVEW